jgi:hypothetical protein
MCLDKEECETARCMDSQSCYGPICDAYAGRKAVPVSALVA